MKFKFEPGPLHGFRARGYPPAGRQYKPWNQMTETERRDDLIDAQEYAAANVRDGTTGGDLE